jgi:hypothetical protein
MGADLAKKIEPLKNSGNIIRGGPWRGRIPIDFSPQIGKDWKSTGRPWRVLHERFFNISLAF